MLVLLSHVELGQLPASVFETTLNTYWSHRWVYSDRNIVFPWSIAQFIECALRLSKQYLVEWRTDACSRLFCFLSIFIMIIGSCPSLVQQGWSLPCHHYMLCCCSVRMYTVYSEACQLMCAVSWQIRMVDTLCYRHWETDLGYHDITIPCGWQTFRSPVWALLKSYSMVFMYHYCRSKGCRDVCLAMKKSATGQQCTQTRG